ncbi:MAG: DNA helicase, partial [Thiomargarita sp.]|nr:DNA helicase [Thiomargarita sp.]
YETIDARVKETYSKDSKATLRNALSDLYVKAIRWASDRIGDEGIVALVTNNSFIDGIAFDGMRQHLAKDFSSVYVLDLGGNVRKNPGKTSNVFDIMVGVSINLFVKNSTGSKGIYYKDIGESLPKDEKLAYLKKNTFSSIDWDLIKPNIKHIWLTQGLHDEFDRFLPLGTKEAKRAKTEAEGVVFKSYSNGVKSNGDAYVFNSDLKSLINLAHGMVANYQSEQKRWDESGQPKILEDFLQVDETRLKWIRNTKRNLLRGNKISFNERKIRTSFYRPFSKKFYYFERMFNEELYQFPKIFLTPSTKNMVICMSGVGSSKPFQTLLTDFIPCLDVLEKTQCFPLYTYTDNTQQDNITDWTLT